MLAGITQMRSQLERADDTLALAGDVFDLIRAACRCYEGRSGTVFAAYAMAATAAVSGRNIVAGASSIRRDRPTPVPDGPLETADPGQVADALAELASALSSRLTSEALSAAHPAGQLAAEQAAAQAEHIQDLLTSG